MSFSSQTKESLMRKRLRTESEHMALLTAITAAIGTITLRRGIGMGIKYTTEAHQVAKLISKCASKLYKVESELTVHEAVSGKRGRVSVLSLFGNDIERLLCDSRLLESDSIIPPEFDEKTNRVYLRGAFLSCGSITDPNKSYHLELVCRNEVAASMIIECAKAYAVEMKYAKRKDNHIVYLKESDSISHFLSIIGADDTVLDFENVRAYRDTRNYANRTRNCDIANIDKTGVAAMHQIKEIEYLLSNLHSDLPEHLHATAVARLQNPDATLADMAVILGIGKSGANHRLQKLLEMAKTLRDNKTN